MTGERTSSTLERVAGLALLALALLVALVGGVQRAREVPAYQGPEESFHVALVEHVADHGTLPNVDDDRFVVDPPGGTAPRGVLVLRSDHDGKEATNPPAGAVAPQLDGIEPPLYPYVTIWAGWLADDAGLADLLRGIDLAFFLAALVLLFLAVRESAPWRGGLVAAGLAPCILAGLPGLESMILPGSPAALGLALLAGMLWALARGLRRGEAPYAVPLLGGLAAVTALQLLPAAAVAVAVSLWARRDALDRRGAGLRVLVLLAPLLVWMVWNLGVYGDPLPLNHGGGEPRARSLDPLWDTPGILLFPFREAIRTMVTIAPTGPDDLLPNAVGMLSVAFVGAAAIVLLRRPRPDGSDRTLMLWGVVWALSFVTVYAGMSLLSVLQGAAADLSPLRFVPLALGWAAFAGPVLVAPLAGLPWRGAPVARVAWASVLGLGTTLAALHALT